MSPLESRASFDESEKNDAKMQEYLGKTEVALEALFTEVSSPTELQQTLQERFEPILESGFVSEECKAIMSEVPEISNITDKKEFLRRMLEVLTPLIEFRVNNSKLYEDMEAQITLKQENFTALNERVSYHVTETDDDGNIIRVNIHLAACHELAETKEERAKIIEELYIDGLKKLVQFAKDNPTLKSVNSTSWLNATKTYGDMKKRMGFEGFGPISEDLRKKHFSDEQRTVISCTLSRQELIDRYGE